MSKKTYYATVPARIHGAHRGAGEAITMTEREAKYLLLSGLVSEDAPAADKPKGKRSEPSPVDLDMKTRGGE